MSLHFTSLALAALGLLAITPVHADDHSEKILSGDLRGAIFIESELIELVVEEIREKLGYDVMSYICVQFHPSPFVNVTLPDWSISGGDVYVSYMVAGIGTDSSGNLSAGYWEFTYDSNGPFSTCIVTGD